MKGTFVKWVKCTFGIGNFGGPPRRDGWQLRPPPPESLAVGRGRRHNLYGFVDKWYIGKVIGGKGLVFATVRKGLTTTAS